MENILNYAKDQAVQQASSFVIKRNGKVLNAYFNDTEGVYITFLNNVLKFDWEDAKMEWEQKNGKASKKNLGIEFVCGFETKGGYVSTKKLPVIISDVNNVTLEEAAQIIEFQTQANNTKFDPFYKQHQAQRKSNSAWNFIAANYIQPDCR